MRRNIRVLSLTVLYPKLLRIHDPRIRAQKIHDGHQKQRGRGQGDGHDVQFSGLAQVRLDAIRRQCERLVQDGLLRLPWEAVEVDGHLGSCVTELVESDTTVTNQGQTRERRSSV